MLSESNESGEQNAMFDAQKIEKRFGQTNEDKKENINKKKEKEKDKEKDKGNEFGSKNKRVLAIIVGGIQEIMEIEKLQVIDNKNVIVSNIIKKNNYLCDKHYTKKN